MGEKRTTKTVCHPQVSHTHQDADTYFDSLAHLHVPYKDNWQRSQCPVAEYRDSCPFDKISEQRRIFCLTSQEYVNKEKIQRVYRRVEKPTAVKVTDRNSSMDAPAFTRKHWIPLLLHRSTLRDSHNGSGNTCYHSEGHDGIQNPSPRALCAEDAQQEETDGYAGTGNGDDGKGLG